MPMNVLDDCFGNSVRLTAERLAHILEHPEMAGLAVEIPNVLRQLLGALFRRPPHRLVRLSRR